MIHFPAIVYAFWFFFVNLCIYVCDEINLFCSYAKNVIGKAMGLIPCYWLMLCRVTALLLFFLRSTGKGFLQMLHCYQCRINQVWGQQQLDLMCYTVDAMTNMIEYCSHLFSYSHGQIKFFCGRWATTPQKWSFTHC